MKRTWVETYRPYKGDKAGLKSLYTYIANKEIQPVLMDFYMCKGYIRFLKDYHFYDKFIEELAARV